MKIKLEYKGQTMQVFHQLQVGRYRLYHAALPAFVTTVKEAWEGGRLGQLFTVQPMHDMVLGEEVLDGKRQVVAVFGIAATNAFVPDQELQQKYLSKLNQVINQM